MNDTENEIEKPKTAKQLEKEAKKAAKLAKFAQKQAKNSLKVPDKLKEESIGKEKKKEEVSLFFIMKFYKFCK